MKCVLFTLMIVILFFPVALFCKAPNLHKVKIPQLRENTKNETNNITGKGFKSFASTLSIQKEHVKSFKNNSLDIFHNSSRHGFPEQYHSNAQSSSAHENTEKELPVALIIAVPTTAVSIFLFLCVSYYFHNAQLNRKAKRLSRSLYVPPDLTSLSSNCSSPSQTHKYIHTTRSSRDNDMLGPRRKSMISIHTLAIPSSIQGKRGPNWSALADQEILNLSAPRRHSTFIL